MESYEALVLAVNGDREVDNRSSTSGECGRRPISNGLMLMERAVDDIRSNDTDAIGSSHARCTVEGGDGNTTRGGSWSQQEVGRR